MIENISIEEKVLGIIIRRNYSSEGIQFFTPDDFSQQLGYMKRPKGHIIPPHTHNAVNRTVQHTKEVLFIKRGSIRVDFYDENQTYFQSTILKSGDVILLAFGGHGFEVLEESEIFEVKQGPYAGEHDKVQFQPISKRQIITR